MAIDFVYSSGSYGREREAMHDVAHECAVEEGFDAEVEVGGGADDGRAEVVVVVAPLLGLGSGAVRYSVGGGVSGGDSGRGERSYDAVDVQYTLSIIPRAGTRTRDGRSSQERC